MNANTPSTMQEPLFSSTAGQQSNQSVCLFSSTIHGLHLTSNQDNAARPTGAIGQRQRTLLALANSSRAPSLNKLEHAVSSLQKLASAALSVRAQAAELTSDSSQSAGRTHISASVNQQWALDPYIDAVQVRSRVHNKRGARVKAASKLVERKQEHAHQPAGSYYKKSVHISESKGEHKHWDAHGAGYDSDSSTDDDDDDPGHKDEIDHHRHHQDGKQKKYIKVYHAGPQHHTGPEKYHHHHHHKHKKSRKHRKGKKNKHKKRYKSKKYYHGGHYGKKSGHHEHHGHHEYKHQHKDYHHHYKPHHQDNKKLAKLSLIVAEPKDYLKSVYGKHHNKHQLSLAGLLGHTLLCVNYLLVLKQPHYDKYSAGHYAKYEPHGSHHAVQLKSPIILAHCGELPEPRALVGPLRPFGGPPPPSSAVERETADASLFAPVQLLGNLFEPARRQLPQPSQQPELSDAHHLSFPFVGEREGPRASMALVRDHGQQPIERPASRASARLVGRRNNLLELRAQTVELEARVLPRRALFGGGGGGGVDQQPAPPNGRTEEAAGQLLNDQAQVELPEHALAGDSLELICKHQLPISRIYSVKWFKDQLEFYRFVPGQAPGEHKSALFAPGVRVDLARSSARSVFLRNLSHRSSGIYRCEVIAEAPGFELLSGERRMQVFALPERGPQLALLEQGEFAPSQLAPGAQRAPATGPMVRCVSDRSSPEAQVSLFVNGRQLSLARTIENSTLTFSDRLESSVVAIALQPSDFLVANAQLEPEEPSTNSLERLASAREKNNSTGSRVNSNSANTSSTTSQAPKLQTQVSSKRTSTKANSVESSANAGIKFDDDEDKEERRGARPTEAPKQASAKSDRKQSSTDIRGGGGGGSSSSSSGGGSGSKRKKAKKKEENNKNGRFIEPGQASGPALSREAQQPAAQSAHINENSRSQLGARVLPEMVGADKLALANGKPISVSALIDKSQNWSKNDLEPPTRAAVAKRAARDDEDQLLYQFTTNNVERSAEKVPPKAGLDLAEQRHHRSYMNFVRVKCVARVHPLNYEMSSELSVPLSVFAAARHQSSPNMVTPSNGLDDEQNSQQAIARRNLATSGASPLDPRAVSMDRVAQASRASMSTVVYDKQDDLGRRLSGLVSSVNNGGREQKTTILDHIPTNAASQPGLTNSLFVICIISTLVQSVIPYVTTRSRVDFP